MTLEVAGMDLDALAEVIGAVSFYDESRGSARHALRGEKEEKEGRRFFLLSSLFRPPPTEQARRKKKKKKKRGESFFFRFHPAPRAPRQHHRTRRGVEPSARPLRENPSMKTVDDPARSRKTKSLFEKKAQKTVPFPSP